MAPSRILCSASDTIIPRSKFSTVCSRYLIPSLVLLHRANSVCHSVNNPSPSPTHPPTHTYTHSHIHPPPHTPTHTHTRKTTQEPTVEDYHSGKFYLDLFSRNNKKLLACDITPFFYLALVNQAPNQSKSLMKARLLVVWRTANTKRTIFAGKD